MRLGPLINDEALYEALRRHGMRRWLDHLPRQLEQQWQHAAHGHLEQWCQTLEALPEITPSIVRLDCDRVTVGHGGDITPAQSTLFTTALQQLKPWRKGPFSLFGIDIDTEWRSDWKWQRLVSHVQPLAGRTVLDIGCGNGYHLWRAAGNGARLAVGVEPNQRFVMQFAMFKRYLHHHPVAVLPLADTHLQAQSLCFDTVFSMGVLYHRRSPFEHLQILKNCLRPDGELILETLVIDGDEQDVLVPRDRYAKMPNVWFIPSCAALLLWLHRVGFRHPRVVDVTHTSIEEQRRTPWMDFESLSDFLDPACPRRTIEGLPAPQRAIIIAKKP